MPGHCRNAIPLGAAPGDLSSELYCFFRQPTMVPEADFHARAGWISWRNLLGNPSRRGDTFGRSVGDLFGGSFCLVHGVPWGTLSAQTTPQLSDVLLFNDRSRWRFGRNISSIGSTPTF